MNRDSAKVNGEAEVWRAYRVYSADGLRHVALPALLLLTVFALGSGSIELWYFSERWRGLVVLNATYLACGIGHVLLVRARPSWTVGSSIIAASIVHAAVILYFTIEHGSAELCLVIISALLTAQIILHPWSALTQIAASSVPVVGYTLGLKLGLQSQLPSVYPVFSLLTMVMLTGIGAWRLDRHRFEAFRHARGLETAVREQRREHALLEALLNLGRAMNAAIGEPQRLAGELAEHTRRAVGVDWVLLYRWIEQESRWVLAAEAGVPANLLMELEAVSGATEWAPELGGELAQDGAAEVHRSDPQARLPSVLLDRWGIHSVRIQVVAREHRRVGILCCVSVSNDGPFSDDQRRLLRAIATQAAVALENAGLVETSRTAERVKTEFVATVSHELRTPLNVILGYTDLILDGAFGGDHTTERDALERVRFQSLQLLDLIQGILDLNRLEARGVTLSLQRFSVSELMQSLREGIPDNWLSPAVDLRWDGAGVPVTLRSDRAKVEIILRNLIHNALKFTTRGHVAVSAEASAGQTTVKFTVADTGPGILPSDLPVIFEMFGQGQGDPRGGGVGLGLYIVKRLTEALGGTINVVSEPGHGARFTLTLPADQP